MLLALIVGLAVGVVLILIGAAGYLIDASAARHEAGAAEERRSGVL